MTYEELRSAVLEKAGVTEDRDQWDLWDTTGNSLLRNTITSKPIGDRADEKVHILDVILTSDF